MENFKSQFPGMEGGGQGGQVALCGTLRLSLLCLRFDRPGPWGAGPRAGDPRAGMYVRVCVCVCMSLGLVGLAATSQWVCVYVCVCICMCVCVCVCVCVSRACVSVCLCVCL